MAIVQLNPNAGLLDYEAMLETLIAAYTGKPTLTLTNYDNDSAPQVTAGSIFEVGGALFSNNALATPTNYASISVSSTFYIYYDESAGIFVYSETVPVWSDAKQGWYNSADRAFFRMYKDSGGTLYQGKGYLRHKSLGQEFTLDIGNWDMTVSTNISITHGVADYTKIKSVNAIIIRDDSTTNRVLHGMTNSIIDGGVAFITSTVISLYRNTAGVFNGVDYNDPAFNRGRVTIQCEV